MRSADTIYYKFGLLDVKFNQKLCYNRHINIKESYIMKKLFTEFAQGVVLAALFGGPALAYVFYYV